MTNLPTFKQLRHLVTLAEHRHFSKAAAACHVTQSTLSASLKELEATLRAPLVDRTKRSVVFTPSGEEAVRRARDLLDQAEDLVRSAHVTDEPLAGTLRMGVIPTIGPFLLPRVMGRLRRKYPKLRLYLTEDLTGRVIDKLTTGELDLVLLALPYDVGSVETEMLFEDPFRFCCHTDHPLAKEARITQDQLKGENLLLLQDGHCLRQHALSACSLRSRPQVDAFEATSLQTLVQMVDNGLGVTLLPQMAIDAGLIKGMSLKAIPLDGKAQSRQIGLAWRRGTRQQDEFRLLGQELKRLTS
jgi:LysR family hydrogen peroxide-inducible transcriptional activator